MEEFETDSVIVDGVVVPESAVRREGWERFDRSVPDWARSRYPDSRQVQLSRLTRRI